MNWIIIALVVVAVAAYVAWPLRRNALTNENIEYSMSEKASPVVARAALQQLEFDRSMGKIDDDEYRDLRATLEAKLSDEEFESEREVSKSTTPNDADIEAEILIARARRRNLKSQTALWTCGECGREMSGADRFCASCGAAHVAETAIS